MEPEAYDEIRNYIIQQFEENNFNNNSCYNIIKQMPYMTNWEIDSYLTYILKINMPPELKNIVYKYMPPTVLAFWKFKNNQYYSFSDSTANDQQTLLGIIINQQNKINQQTEINEKLSHLKIKLFHKLNYSKIKFRHELVI